MAMPAPSKKKDKSLPVAYTCFNKLDLPDYQDQALFVEKFMKAIQESAVPSTGCEQGV